MFRTLTETIESDYCMGCGLGRHYALDPIEMRIADSGQMLPEIARNVPANRMTPHEVWAAVGKKDGA